MELPQQRRQLDYVEELEQIFINLRPGPTRQVPLKSPYVTQDLQDATHVFVRQAQKKPVRPHYIGPFPVVKKRSDMFVLLVNGKNDTIAFEGLKPAHIERAHVQEIVLPDIDQTTQKRQLRWYPDICLR